MFTISKFHFDMTAKTVSIEFQRLDEKGNILRGKPRHQDIPVSDSLLAMINAEVEPQLSAEISTMLNVPSELLTSELHKVREARAEQIQISEENKKRQAFEFENYDLIKNQVQKLKEEYEDMTSALEIAKNEVDNKIAENAELIIKIEAKKIELKSNE